jgi:hypothetical protein
MQLPNFPHPSHTPRHLYASVKPSVEQRRESWVNYVDLFAVILNQNLNIQLPNGWLWDMVDEFVYQFQSFCQYRWVCMCGGGCEWVGWGGMEG